MQDKLWLPGLLKLKMLIDTGFFGRILSVRGEFGYWVFEGDWQPAQRPSWNYRKEDGGGIILDMLCHWRYVLDNLFGEVKAVSCLGATHIPQALGRERASRTTRRPTTRPTRRSSSTAASIAQINSSWCTRVRRDDLLTFQVDGTHGSAVAGLTDCVHPAARRDAEAGVESRHPAADRLLRRPGRQVPANVAYDNAFKVEWELFLRHVVDGDAVPLEPARRREGRAARRARACRAGRERRWVDVPTLEVLTPARHTGRGSAQRG